MFKDRKEAGQLLAKELAENKGNRDVLVLAIPRGGVVVGHEIAKQLSVDLDIIIIKKIGFPGNPELALGAVSLNNYHLNKEITKDIEKEYLKEQIKIKQKEVKAKHDLLRGGKPAYSVKNKIIILTDDGIATGATMSLAAQILKKQKIKKLIIAIPLAPPEAIVKLKNIADEVICINQPKFLMAIGQFYKNFIQTEDEEVKKLLKNKEKDK